MAHHLARGGPVAAVERRLTAARLRLGKFDRAAEMFKHLDGRARDIVVERIANAGGHELHAAIGGRETAWGNVHEANEKGRRLHGEAQSGTHSVGSKFTRMNQRDAVEPPMHRSQWEHHEESEKTAALNRERRTQNGFQQVVFGALVFRVQIVQRCNPG